MLLAAAALRLLTLGIAGASLSLIGGPDQLGAPAWADDNGSHGGSDGGGSDGGGSGGSSGGSGSGGSGGGDSGSNGSGSDDSGSGNSGKGSGSDDSSNSGAASTSSDASSAATAGGAVDQSGRGGFEAGEIVLLGDHPAALAEAQSLGFRLLEQRPLASLGLSVLRLGTPAGLDPRRAVALLHARYPALIADINSLYAPYETRSAQVLSLPAPDYARRMIGWSGGGDCGAGLRLGMLDSAVAASLPVFAGRRLHQRAFLAGEGAPAPPDHGTAIAALLVGMPDPAHPHDAGLLPEADLYAAAVFESQGGHSAASALAIASALDWMVESRVRIANLSFSGDSNALMALAVSRASARGLTLIAAAGNDGPGTPPAYPGALAQVIAVTAVDQNGAVFPGANRGDYIAFAAPGVRIWTPGPDGRGHYVTGTSFAAPFAAGAAALELMRGAPPDPAELRRRLASRARPLGPGGKNPIYGYGLVQAGGACGATASVP